MRAKEVGGEISAQLSALNEERCEPIRSALDEATSRSFDIRKIRDLFFLSPALIMPIIDLTNDRQERFAESATIVCAYVGLRFLENRINRRCDYLEVQLEQADEDLSWVGVQTGEFIGKVRDSNRHTVRTIWPGVGVGNDLRQSVNQVAIWSTKRVCDPSGEYVIATGHTSDDAEDRRSGLKIVYDVSRKVPVYARVDWNMRGEPQSTALIFSHNMDVDEIIRRRVATGEEIAFIDEVFGDVRALDVKQAGRMRFGNVSMTCAYAHKVDLPVAKRVSYQYQGVTNESTKQVRVSRKRVRTSNGDLAHQGADNVLTFPVGALALLKRMNYHKPTDGNNVEPSDVVRRRFDDKVKVIVGNIASQGGTFDTGMMMPTTIDNFLHFPIREMTLFYQSAYFKELARMGLALLPGGLNNDHHPKLSHAGGLLFTLLYDQRVRTRLAVAGGTVRLECEYLKKNVRLWLFELLHQQHERYVSKKRYDTMLVRYLEMVLDQLE